MGQRSGREIKVCQLTSVHPQDDTRIFVKQCSSLASAGFDTHLVVANGQSESRNGVTIHGVESRVSSRVRRILKTTKRVYEKAVELDADIYHFHDPELLRIAKKLGKLGKKVIYDVHEDIPKQIMGKYWIKKSLRKFVSGAFKRYESRAIRHVDHIVTATPWIAERYLPIHDNVTDINNYPLLGELQSPTPWHQKEEAVCYVGGISAIRGNTQLIDALPKAEGVKLLLAGKCSPESYRDELAKLPGWDSVEELGQIDRPEVARTLGRSLGGVVTFLGLPNHIDAQPNKMFEYMSAGIPVIGSHFPLWRKILEGNDCGLCVNPEDSDQIASAISSLRQDKGRAQQMGANGRRAVEDRYNWGVEEKKLVRIYERLIEG